MQQFTIFKYRHEGATPSFELAEFADFASAEAYARRELEREAAYTRFEIQLNGSSLVSSVLPGRSGGGTTPTPAH